MEQTPTTNRADLIKDKNPYAIVLGFEGELCNLVVYIPNGYLIQGMSAQGSELTIKVVKGREQ